MGPAMRSNCFADHGSHLLSLESLAVVHPQEHYNPADFERPRIQSSSTPPRCVLNALFEDDTDNGCLFVPCCVFLSYEGSGESGEDQINARTLNFCFVAAEEHVLKTHERLRMSSLSMAPVNS